MFLHSLPNVKKILHTVSKVKKKFTCGRKMFFTPLNARSKMFKNKSLHFQGRAFFNVDNLRAQQIIVFSFNKVHHSNLRSFESIVRPLKTPKKVFNSTLMFIIQISVLLNQSSGQ
ncbi:hypothetical protein HanPI659440_Chr15g0600451 [Helianthus annuus]|nr:hypothetical protein HanPI659440_Chr15g0600451 [Helianthus annuus]